MTVATARDYLQMALRTSMSPSAGRQGRSNVVAAIIVRARSQALPATSRHSCSAVCVLVFRRPHRVCLPAVCLVDRVFRSPPVDSKVRPYVRQRRRAGAFGGRERPYSAWCRWFGTGLLRGLESWGRDAAAHFLFSSAVALYLLACTVSEGDGSQNVRVSWR